MNWKAFIVGVAASLVAAAIVGSFALLSSGESESEPAIPTFEGHVDDPHHPAADPDLIDFVLSHEEEIISLQLRLGLDIASNFAEVSNSAVGVRTYSFALGKPMKTLLMDLRLNVEEGDDFFFGISSSGTGKLRGTFRIVGCVQSGTGWFFCDLHAVAAEVVEG